jgi:hypothetical protein
MPCCGDCASLFAEIMVDPEKKKRKVEYIDQAASHCECEKESVKPEYSPGKVGEEEILLRLLYYPFHREKDTGDLKPTAFDDVLNKGLSTNRRSHTTREELEAQAEASIEKARNDGKDRSLAGVIEFPVGHLRSIRVPDTEDRALCVYDTAEQFNRSHADVCATSRARIQKRVIRSIVAEKFKLIHPDVQSAISEINPSA